MTEENTSSPIRFLKPFQVFRCRKRDKSVITLDDFSPLKCLNQSPRRTQATTTVPRFFPQLTSPSRGQQETKDSPATKKRRLDLTPVKTSQTPSPAKTKVIKRQLNFGGIFNSPSSPVNESAQQSKMDEPTTPSSSARRNSKGKQDKKKGPNTPSITTLFKPLSKTSSLTTNQDHPNSSRSGLTRSASSSSMQEIKTLLRTPIDWSLKTRIRFVSRNHDFPFRGSFRASEDATGTSSFVRCVNNKNDGLHSGVTTEDSLSQATFSPPHSLSRIELDTSSTAILRQQTMVWMHPHLPWMPLYPRMGVTLGSSTAIPSLPLSATEVLCKDFVQSLRSVYHLLKTRQSAFFYVCAPTFTVLFRAAGVGGMIDVVHALITPSSRGFRTLLEEEHVVFNQLETESDDDSKDDKVTAGQNNDKDDDNDPNLFLETLGLSQQDFPSLSSFPRGQKMTSKGDSTTLLVSGPDTQSLVNVLSEHVCKICVAKTGPLAGIPPTILSPMAFAGSTLRPFKIKVASDTLQDGTVVYSLDIHGPILPTNVYNLCETLRSNQAVCPFDVTMVNHEPTSQFARVSKQLSDKTTPASVFMTQSLTDCGLSDQLIADLCSIDTQTRRPTRQLRLQTNCVAELL